MNRHVLPVFVLLVTPFLAGCLAQQDVGARLLAEPPVAASHALEPFVTGLDRPVQFIVHPRHDGGFFVAEMGGTVRAVDPDGRAGDPWLDIADRLGTRHREQGLLGLALHPAFPEDPRVFVTYVAPNDDVVLAAYEAPEEGPIDTATEKVLLRVPQPKPYHNGGHVAFGPDGLLYAAFGDGGPQGDPNGHAQDLHNLLGSVIRIDVDVQNATEAEHPGWSVPADNPFVGREGRDEIWLYGLRNPWRFSFDPPTGDLWIADVGYQDREEIDRIPQAFGGGHNLGWPQWEGSQMRDIDRPIDVPVLFPVHEYPREEPCSSVSGGNVYRGSDLPALVGAYVFSDFCTGAIRALHPDDGRWTVEELVATGLPIAGFGEGTDGTLYVLSFGGSVHRLVAADPDA